MKIGKAVALRATQLMIKNNMNAYQVAVKSMIPHSTLFNILNELHQDIKLSTLYRLAFAFDMDILEFMNDDVFKNVDILKELA